MTTEFNLTEGSISKKLAMFAIPYLISAFLQTFYGMADLLIVGIFNTSDTTTAVSVGSQFTHMVTVIIIGLAMGITVRIGNCVGAKDMKRISKIVGNSALFFAIFSAALALVLLPLTPQIVSVMNTPIEAVSQTKSYLGICFLGLPFICAYNVLSAIYRGMGDSKSPMIFVSIACVINLALDFVLIGFFGMGASGAAVATVVAQFVSSLIALFKLKRINASIGIRKEDFKLNADIVKEIVFIGGPVAMQDGLIQVSFLVITVIANSRGLTDAASVGIVEKIISFMFLVPSALLSAISALTAQNIGAGKKDRAEKTLFYGMVFAFCYGLLAALVSNLIPESMVGLFTRDALVVAAGARYLMSYAFDVPIAGIHFCFSGYFTGRGKSLISFIHNILSVIIIRVPGAYFTSKYYPDDLFPMGLAAPLGSALSAVICITFFVLLKKKDKTV
ncbi:MAG: MATE family efflux transporter [Lachnospiraceae bacterium]|nr:MATE family efflux transporter [Lachnospiraceae bacterium]